MYTEATYRVISAALKPAAATIIVCGAPFVFDAIDRFLDPSRREA